MPNAVMFISFKLVEGASVSDFLVASKRTHDEVLSKKKGFISWKVLADGDTWADLVTWETMDDAINAAKDDGNTDPIAQEFYSFLDQNSINFQLYSVEKSY